MLHLRSCTATAFAAMILIALSAAPGAAEPTTPRPDGGDFYTCYIAKGTDFGCEGLLCWCCHSNGCFICNQDFTDCVWDPAYRLQGGHPARVGRHLQQLNPNQTLTTTKPPLTVKPSPIAPAQR